MKAQKLLLIILLIPILNLFFTPYFPHLSGANLGDDYFEDFEGLSGFSWSLSGLWHVEENNATSPWNYTWTPSESHYLWYGKNSTGNFNTSNLRNWGVAESDPIGFTNLNWYFPGRVELGFWSRAETDRTNDQMNVSIAIDGGPWIHLGDIGDSPDWEYYSYDITSYKFGTNYLVIRFSFDTLNGFQNYGRGWMIDNVEIKDPGSLDLAIHQDMYALQWDIKWIDFEIYSSFDYGQNINVTIDFTSPSLAVDIFTFNFEYIESWSYWYQSLEYKFEEQGVYLIQMTVEDEKGRYWYTNCTWDIGPYMDLIIEHDPYALQGDIRRMDFFVYSYFNIPKTVEILINITTPSGVDQNLYWVSSLTIPLEGKWSTNLNYSFAENGDYHVYMAVKDTTGKQWTSESMWYIGPYLDLTIEPCFDNNAAVNETKWMTFSIVPRGFTSDQTVNISINMHYESGETDFIEWLRVTIPVGGSWSNNYSYTFRQPGHYDVEFFVINDIGAWWDIWCCWNVGEDVNKEGFETWIEQQYNATINEEVWMSLHIKSNFPEERIIDISVTMIYPDGYEDVFFMESSVHISSGETLKRDLSYTFSNSGEYKVMMKIVDNFDEEWFADCWWNIFDLYGDNDTTRNDDGDRSDISITPGFESLVILTALIAVIPILRKHRKY